MPAKLTKEQVAEIRASAESGKALAARHGVSQPRISAIRGGEAAAEKKREYRREYKRERYGRDPEFRKREIEAALRWQGANREKFLEYQREHARRRRARKQLGYKAIPKAAR